jgi:hypothetical protein
VGIRYIYAGAILEANAFSFNITGGTDEVQLSQNFRNIDFTGFSGTFSIGNNIIVYGDITIPVTMATSGNAYLITLAGTTATQILDTNGVSIIFPITKNSTSSVELASNLTQASGTAFTLNNGNVNLNGKTFTTPRFVTATGTKSITFNGGTLQCTSTTLTPFDNAVPLNFTTSAGTGVGTISLTSDTAKSFIGGGATFAAKLNQGGLGALTITGSNTFDDITNTVQPASVLFTAATTTTVNNFSLSGTTGNLITIGSATAASHTLSKASGEVTISNCSISRSNATGGATWRAPTNLGNVDGANNTGWSFAAIVIAIATSISNFFSFF